MEPSGDALAPELELDDKAQYGFVQWFNALPQVGSRTTLETRDSTDGCVPDSRCVRRTRLLLGSSTGRQVDSLRQAQSSRKGLDLTFSRCGLYAGLLLCAWGGCLVHC